MAKLRTFQTIMIYEAKDFSSAADIAKTVKSQFPYKSRIIRLEEVQDNLPDEEEHK